MVRKNNLQLKINDYCKEYNLSVTDFIKILIKKELEERNLKNVKN